ncbi:granzyme-like protein 1 [Spea bombifrons]|uniref:granzyme-like protein 1 n=1 Tax=Spea bombifrons TaxID=233779 RepID=UPI00234AEE5D|nr:granzyme-like protein 1 [Spea bombifrons]
MALHRPLILLEALLYLYTFIIESHEGPLNDRIIGGHEVAPHSKPWMAYITYTNDAGERLVCGGFLISRDLVMTAAHCAGSNIKVSLGLHYLRDRNDQNTFPVYKIYRHNNYDSKTHDSDIMILRINQEVTLSDAIQVITLPKKNKRVAVGTVCNVAGWGQAGEDSMSQVLMEVNVTVVGNKKCEELLSVPISSAMMCAGQPGTTGDAAQGDSGSPLVCGGVPIGIVSFGHEKPPGAYTHIPSFLPWIRKIIVPFSKPALTSKAHLY